MKKNINKFLLKRETSIYMFIPLLIFIDISILIKFENNS